MTITPGDRVQCSVTGQHGRVKDYWYGYINEPDGFTIQWDNGASTVATLPMTHINKETS